MRPDRPSPDHAEFEARVRPHMSRVYRYCVGLTGDRDLAADVFQSRLGRAIELRLTVEAALAERVTLTPDQDAAIARVRQSYVEAGTRAKAQGLQWTSVTEAQVVFEQSLTRALLLQQRLVEKRGGPSPMMPAEYDDAVGALLSELRDGATIARSSAP